tara:strand:+ start:6171 stop:7085 length:915 start_codon:yes stop_codon:yes gene_type:complete
MVYDSFILGGSGLLGSNWLVSNRQKENLATSIHKKIIRLEKVDNFKFEAFDEKYINVLLSEIKPKKIINTIGMTNIEECEKNQEKAININVEIPKIFARICFERSIKFVHISTDQLFDGKKEIYTEDNNLSPLNFYGKTKALAEEFILKENKNALIIRTNFYCWGPAYRKSFSDFIFDALSSNKKIHLFEDVFYSPIKVKELIFIIQSLININSKGIFNVVSSERLSKYNFGMLLSDVFKFKKSLISSSLINSRLDLISRPKNMCLSNLKLLKELNIRLNSVRSNLIELKEELNSEDYLILKKL